MDFCFLSAYLAHRCSSTPDQWCQFRPCKFIDLLRNRTKYIYYGTVLIGLFFIRQEHIHQHARYKWCHKNVCIHLYDSFSFHQYLVGRSRLKMPGPIFCPSPALHDTHTNKQSHTQINNHTHKHTLIHMESC